ncbi:MAG: hypothetical protein Q8O76_04040, partial [Chloroflexota bacterium]|nr:hypothetical protein [Chloroflexota bacterium]
NLEGSIPRDKNVLHELFAKHTDKWFDHLKTVRPDFTSLVRGWWLENARIRSNEPERYKQRHIRRDWYGYAEDSRPYSGKIFLLPLEEALGLKPQPSEEYYDRFHKTLKDMVWDDIFDYDVLHLWPEAEYGVRDIDVRRAKACPAVIIATEKMIGEPKLKEFTTIYGVTVRTSVFKKPSTLSDWAVISEFVEQLRGRDTPILLVTLADYDFDGITGVHLAFEDHFSKYYPTVRHAICGVFPSQLPVERLTPGDALYELDVKSVGYWLKAVERGEIPADMPPYEYKGKYYGVEMDVAGVDAFLPTIVEKLEELGCTQDSWTDWAREQTFPDVGQIEKGEISSFASELPEHKQLSAVRSQVSKERWKIVEEYDRLSSALMGLEGQVEGKAREELKGIADDVAYEEGFDDRGRPETHTLIARVATQPLKPYEEYWDEETKTGFSRSYLEEKLREELRDRYEEKLDDVKVRVEELEGEIHRRKEEAIDLLNEVRTPSRVRG